MQPINTVLIVITNEQAIRKTIGNIAIMKRHKHIIYLLTSHSTLILL